MAVVLPLANNALGASVTVVCQTAGSYVRDPTFPNEQGSMWDRISSPVRGYVSDIYVRTPQSVAGHYSSYSNPPLWPCT